jgi:antitoxin component of MazEF toxin-antitoxin module
MVIQCIDDVVTGESVDMVKKLTQHGNSLALVLDRPILDLIKIDADTPLEISTDGQRLIISPIRAVISDKDFKAALAHVNRKHGKTLKRLAE